MPPSGAHGGRRVPERTSCANRTSVRCRRDRVLAEPRVRGSRSIAALVALLLLVPAAAGVRRRRLVATRYAQRTWASFGGDDRHGRPACRPTSSTPTARPASRPRRPTSAPTCGARSPRSGSASSPSDELVARLSRDDHDARAHGALRRHRPVLQLVRPPHGREADRLAAEPDREFHPILSSVDNGWLAVGPEDRARTACPQLSPRARRALRRDGLRLLLPARRQPGAVPLPARTTRPRRRAATTPSSARAGSSTTSASRAASCRRRSTTGAGARFPDTCDWAWQETKPIGVDAHLLRRRRLRGRLPVRRHAGHAVVGRLMFEALMPALFVPEETLGAAQLGRQPPAHGARADPPRHDRGRLRRTGASRPSNTPEGGYGAYGVDGDRHGPERQPVQRGQHARRPRLRGLPRPRPRSPTRRRRRTPTASSRRTPRSSRCATRPTRRCAERRAGSRATSPACTAVGLPRQRERPDRDASPTPTSRSTRG